MSGSRTRRAVTTVQYLVRTSAVHYRRRSSGCVGAAAAALAVLTPTRGDAQISRPESRDLHSTGGRYSHVVVAEGGRTVYVAGQVALDPAGELVGPGDFRAQARQVLANVAAALHAGGATWDDVVKINTYLTDMANLPILREVRSEIVRGPPPASTTVQVVRLFRDDLLIEMDAVAVVPERRGTAAAATTSATAGGPARTDVGTELNGSSTAGGAPNDSSAVLVARVTGFKAPESAQYDAELDRWFVSNVNGPPAAKDGNGFISRLRPDGSVHDLTFIGSGLDAPKGMTIRGDTLWVTDVDVVRAFDKRTGAPLEVVDLSPQRAVFLNDVAFGPDGALYVTDTGVRFDSAGTRIHSGPDRIFRVEPDGSAAQRVTAAAEGDWLQQPNGIFYDPARQKFLIAPVAGTTLLAWSPGEQAQPVAQGSGRYDGVASLESGEILVSCWNDSTVSVLRDGRLVPVLSQLPSPADIGVDPDRRVVAVPLIRDHRVELWQLPGRAEASPP